jgi:hypothetical protein
MRPQAGLYLNPRLLTELDGRQLELLTVRPHRARPGSGHRDTPWRLGGSVYESGASTLVSCSATLGGRRAVRQGSARSKLSITRRFVWKKSAISGPRFVNRPFSPSESVRCNVARPMLIVAVSRIKSRAVIT